MSPALATAVMQVSWRVLLLGIVLAINTSGLAGAVEVNLSIVDRLGRSHPAPFVVINPSNFETVASVSAGNAAEVSPGTWVVAPFSDLSSPVAIEVTDGKPLAIEVQAEDALWLHLLSPTGDPAQSRWTLLRLKDAEATRMIFSHLSVSRPDVTYRWAMRRPDVDAATRDAGIALARDEYFGQRSVERQAPDEAKRAAEAWALRILSAWGDESDVEKLIQPDRNHPYFSAWVDMMTVAARIEARLGRLDTGYLIRLLDAPDRAAAANAALVLHEFGVAAADDWLKRNIIEDPRDERELDWQAISRALLSFPPDQARPAFQRLIKRLLERRAEIVALPEDQREDQINEYDPFPLLLFFLAQGGDDELRALADEPVSWYDAPALAFLASDPTLLARSLFVDWAASNRTTNSWDTVQLASLCLGAIGLPADSKDEYFQKLEKAVHDEVAVRLAAREDLFDSDKTASPSYYTETMSQAASFCRPVESTVRSFIEKNTPPASWIPPQWKDEEYLDRLLQGGFERTTIAMLLDTVPPDRMATLLAARGDAVKAYPFDLYSAYSRLVDRANFAFPMGAEGAKFFAMVLDDTDRRPYVFGRLEEGSTEYGGGFTGLISMRPELVAGRLRLHIGLAPIRHDYLSCNAFLCEERKKDSDWPHDRYARDGGRSLISAVRLFRADDEVKVTEVAHDEEGNFVFEADIAQPDLAGLHLRVELAFFDQRRSIGYDLFAGDYAIALRKAAHAQ